MKLVTTLAVFFISFVLAYGDEIKFEPVDLMDYGEMGFLHRGKVKCGYIWVASRRDLIRLPTAIAFQPDGSCYARGSSTK